MVNDAALKLIKSFEKLRLKAYDDVQPNIDISDPNIVIRGHKTIGFGHTGNDVQRDSVCTAQQADDWLMEDIMWAENKVKKLCTARINENMRGALVSLTYNSGGGFLDNSTHKYIPYKLWSVINNGLSERVIRDRWSTTAITSKGAVQNGLIKRRLAEMELFFTPVK